jgi:hypothetical protein
MPSELQDHRKSRHDRHAPFWAAGLVLLCATGLATIWIDLGTFWKGYVLDMTGPAWNYILFRTRFTSESDNLWTRFFTPLRTVLIFVAVCSTIEGAQYFALYDATFDPWDFLAYVSILVPLFLVDLITYRRMS